MAEEKGLERVGDEPLSVTVERYIRSKSPMLLDQAAADAVCALADHVDERLRALEPPITAGKRITHVPVEAHVAAVRRFQRAIERVGALAINARIDSKYVLPGELFEALREVWQSGSRYEGEKP